MAWLAQPKGALLLILACGVLAFHNILGNGFHYDDEHSILENPHLRSLKNIPSFFTDAGTFSGMPEARMYRPVLLFTYALNYAAGGYQAWGFHLFNLLVHLANAALVWHLATRLGLERDAALCAGLFFAVHPAMTEPVNYISSRSSLLAAFFVLLAFLALLRQGQVVLPMGAAYLAGLGAKETAFVFPALAGVYMRLTGERSWRLLVVPMALAALYLAGTRAIVGKALGQPVRAHQEQLATQVKAMVFYLWKVAAPVHLSVEPQFRVAGHFGEGAVVLAGLALASLGAVCLWGARRGWLLVFGAAWFVIALLPSSLVPLNVLVNEHRLYLPMVGLALGLGGVLQGERAAVRGVWALVFAAMIALAVQRNAVWKDEETLWRDAVQKGLAMPRPHVNLGKALLEQGRFAEAIVASHKALEIQPELERAHYNIGTAYMHQEKYELAEAHLRRALEIRPDLLPAHNNLGNTYQEQGRFAEALAAYRKALEIQEHASLYHNLGNAFLEAGQADSARLHFRQALSLEPDMREAHKGLAKAYGAEDMLQAELEVLQEALRRWPGDGTFLLMAGDAHAALGQPEQAVAAYRQAGRSPADAWRHLGRQALGRHHWEQARSYFEKALHTGGETAQARNDLGTALLGLGRVEEALEAFRQAARLDPGLAVAFANIGRIYLRNHRPLEAIAALERAAALDPKSAEWRGLLAQAYERGAKGEQAMAAYRRAVELAPQSAAYRHNLGVLQYRAGHLAEAERLYREALERDPELVEALYNLGVLYLEQKRFDQAVAVYEKVLELEPEHADAHVNLASAWLNLGEREKAIQAYERVLELGVEEQVRARVQAQLEALGRVE